MAALNRAIGTLSIAHTAPVLADLQIKLSDDVSADFSLPSPA